MSGAGGWPLRLMLHRLAAWAAPAGASAPFRHATTAARRKARAALQASNTHSKSPSARGAAESRGGPGPRALLLPRASAPAAGWARGRDKTGVDNDARGRHLAANSRESRSADWSRGGQPKESDILVPRASGASGARGRDVAGTDIARGERLKKSNVLLPRASAPAAGWARGRDKTGIDNDARGRHLAANARESRSADWSRGGRSKSAAPGTVLVPHAGVPSANRARGRDSSGASTNNRARSADLSRGRPKSVATPDAVLVPRAREPAASWARGRDAASNNSHSRGRRQPSLERASVTTGRGGLNQSQSSSGTGDAGVRQRREASVPRTSSSAVKTAPSVAPPGQRTHSRARRASVGSNPDAHNAVPRVRQLPSLVWEGKDVRWVRGKESANLCVKRLARGGVLCIEPGER